MTPATPSPPPPQRVHLGTAGAFVARQGKVEVVDLKKPAAPPPEAPKIDPAMLKAEYDRGRKEAEAPLQKELASQKSRVSSLEKELADSRRQLAESFDLALQQLEHQLLEESAALGIAVAERILAASFPSHADLPAVLREALQGVANLKAVTLRLHPDDADAVARNHSFRLCRIEPDSSLARGEAFAEHEHGIVDATLHARLDCIRIAVEKALHHGQQHDESGHAQP
ncbi:MAG: Flagellar assembly protein FliH [Verrucomicrobiota bacterium]|jgi:flagellar biosynthesis/type III secretory pathway protein FliH